jgi:mannose-6-phosphate isomerase
MPLFLKPVLHEKIWGGTKLKELGYDLPTNNIGEAWEFQHTQMVDVK